MSGLIDPRLQENDGAARLPYPRPSESSDPYYRQAPAPHSTMAQDSPGQIDDSGELEQASPNNDDPKRPRACESCRGLKVRCDQDPTNPDAPCRRCAKAGRPCEYTQPSRKRQKKADSRVADLEKKLDALTAALHAQQYAHHGLSMGSTPTAPMMMPPNQDPMRHVESHHPSAAYADGQSSAFGQPSQMGDIHSNKRRRTEGSFESTPANLHPRYDPVRSKGDAHVSAPEVPPQHTDFLTKDEYERLLRSGVRGEMYHTAPEALIATIRDLVATEYHARIFDRFIGECLPNMPVVAFAPGTSANEVLEAKPILFLTILAAAGFGIVSAEQMSRLVHKLAEVFAACTIVRGVKSLELVQAMVVCFMWYKPPSEAQGHMNFYVIIHSAAVMALDLGLGKRFNLVKARRGFGGPASDLPPGRLTAMVDSDSMEGRRTWLACYFSCAAAAMSLRRPNLIRWSSYMQECVEVLSTSKDAAPSDRYFVQIILMQKICEDVGAAFQMDDPSATAISITDPKVSYTLDVHDQKLKEWRKNVPEELKGSNKLSFFYEIATLYLNEIAMHVNHNVDDFQLPFTEEALSSTAQQAEVLTQRQMAALEACLRSAQNAISIYCSFGEEAAGTLPTLLFFIRCIYALVVLIKMHMAVSAPNSEVSKIIKPEDVRVEEHMDLIWEQFQRMAKYAKDRPHGKVLKILALLREWLIRNKDAKAAESRKETKTESKSAPFGRNPHGTNSKLQVLSEAATASTGPESSSAAAREIGNAAHPQNQNWTFESPHMFGPRGRGEHGSMSSSGQATATTPSNSIETPGPSGNHAQQYMDNQPNQMAASKGVRRTYGDGFNGFFSPSGGENLDWAAGMDLDQVLDGAFRDLDTSGDLGGWFFGDGVGAYQIPVEGAPPQGGGLDGRW